MSSCSPGSRHVQDQNAQARLTSISYYHSTWPSRKSGQAQSNCALWRSANRCCAYSAKFCYRQFTGACGPYVGHQVWIRTAFTAAYWSAPERLPAQSCSLAPSQTCCALWARHCCSCSGFGWGQICCCCGWAGLPCCCPAYPRPGPGQLSALASGAMTPAAFWRPLEQRRLTPFPLHAGMWLNHTWVDQRHDLQQVQAHLWIQLARCCQQLQA